MVRYITIVWNAKSEADCIAVSNMRRRMETSSVDWRCALARPGIYVACVHREWMPNTAIQLDDRQGVILGMIFQWSGPCESDNPTPMRLLSGGQSDEVLRSKGRSLISHYWGHYVAVLHYPDIAAAIVVRSPASPLACFHVEQGTLNVFFSHLEDCIDLKLAPLSINWDGIAAQVSGGDYLTNETAINEIGSLECGEGMECGRHGCVRHIYWDPRTFLEERSSKCFSEAARSIRYLTDSCVRAHSSRHDKILVKLSGGLDSSIILSSLSRVPHKPSITAVNYYSAGSGDERHFARSMAGVANCRLLERSRNEQLNLRRLLDCNRTARPVLNFSAPDVESRNIALAHELRATAIFDGELGDNLFGSCPGPGALAECLRQHGWGREFFCSAMDYAMLTRQSLWRALVLARRESLSASRDPDFSAAREIQRVLGAEGARSAVLASREVEEHYRSMAGRFLHPWFKQSRRIAPGAHALLFGLLIVTSTSYHSPFSGTRDPPRVSPLVSQPLIEMVLRTPAHLHFKFALDRALARTAFADVLPQAVLQRGLGKGGPDAWLRAVIENNVGFLREFLLDGILVRRRLIDRTKLETVLSPRIAKSTVVAGDIFAKLYIEAWIRRW